MIALPRLRVVGRVLVRKDLQTRRRAIDDLATVVELDALDHAAVRGQVDHHALAGTDRAYRLEERAAIREAHGHAAQPNVVVERDQLESTCVRRVRLYEV